MTETPEERAYQEAWDDGYNAGYADGSEDVWAALTDDESPAGG